MIIQNCNAEIKQNGREAGAHGTALLPAACYADDLARQPVAWHWHDEMEAAVVTEGAALLFAGAVQLTITEGNGFFLNAGCLHRMSADRDGACKMHVVVFHPKLVGGSMDSLFWQKYLLPLMQNSRLEAIPLPRTEAWCAAAMADIEDAWQAEAGEAEGYEFALRTALSELIFRIYGHVPGGDFALPRRLSRDSERMKRMLGYIQSHFAEELTLEEIAGSAAVSKSECLRCFKSIVNLSPIQYVKQYRLQRAAELLAASHDKIIDVAHDCGFREMSYFAKEFRRFKGMSPSEYRHTRSTL